MRRFDDKVALVTGGRGGIGRAIALKLREEGARVFTVQRTADDLFEHVTADLSDASEADRVVAEVSSASGGQLDILVNCAGVMQSASIETISLDDWNRSLVINVTMPFLLIQAALPLLRASVGSIVNIGSIEGIGANPNHAAYAASKAALHALSRAVAIDHGAEGIRCNVVAPGWIDTELNDEMSSRHADPASFRAALHAIHPLARTGKPQEVAALVAWLASDEASFVTGQTWAVDGGRMSKLSLPC